MSRWKRLIKNPRIIVLLVVLLLAVVAINPQADSGGVAIRQVVRGSAAQIAGFESPNAGAMPTQREVITSINGMPVTNVDDYFRITNALPYNTTITIQTGQSMYRLMTRPIYEKETVETENGTITINGEPVGTEDIGLVVYDAPENNIGRGLDLSGGTRVILQPEHQVSPEDMDFILENIEQRLNAFGVSDVIVRTANDLSGTDFIVVEVPGVNKGEVRDLLGSQGVFEARISNQTVFSGDELTSVCTTPECSGIDTRSGGCQPSTEGGWVCRFAFAIKLSEGAARSQADATRELDIVSDQGGAYLSQPLDLYLDNELVDSLQIAADLKGRSVTDIQISGSGSGSDERTAQEETIANMKRLQTILKTGSLPVKLEIVKMDAISPVLGEEFVRNAMLMGLGAILAVALVIFFRYRKLAISIPVVITMLSEAVIILGVASFIRWNLDLAAIAGIIIAIGTGVDDQIVIVDETMSGESDLGRTWKARLKRAFFIIFAAYATTVVAMVPLIWAGVGLLKGFAITTIIGVTTGVLVARPAFAAMVEIFLKDEE